MLAIAPLELLAPGEGLRHVHMDVLGGLQADQGLGPDQTMQKRKGDDEPEAGLGIPDPRQKPRCRTTEDGTPAPRAGGGGPKRCNRHALTRSAFSAQVE